MRWPSADIGGRGLTAEKNKYPISNSQYFSFLALLFWRRISFEAATGGVLQKKVF